MGSCQRWARTAGPSQLNSSEKLPEIQCRRGLLLMAKHETTSAQGGLGRSTNLGQPSVGAARQSSFSDDAENEPGETSHISQRGHSRYRSAHGARMKSYCSTHDAKKLAVREQWPRDIPILDVANSN
ncbi:hypothetical protein BD413DRAFT_566153 [Trametes elegans]|nr:hypothetical protein BD413DRAFT_566153 [Trametes elegans]